MDFKKPDISVLIEKVEHCIQHAMSDLCECKDKDTSCHSLEHALKLIDEFWRMI